MNLRDVTSARRGLSLLALLLLALTLSCIGLVYTRHESRELFIELQELSRERDALNTQYHQLQLEQSAHAAFSEIEKMAPEKLGLHAPSVDEVYLIGDDGRYWFTGLAPMSEATAARIAEAQASQAAVQQVAP